MSRPEPGLDPAARLRAELVALLQSGVAHASAADILDGIPFERVNERPDGFPHSLWELVYHLWFDQHDMIDFFHDSNHEIPASLWPEEDATLETWETTRTTFLDDLNALIARVEDEATDLFAEMPHQPGFTVLREALIVADHNVYHLGQVVAVRRLLGLWGE